jgi:hypothetical protein
MIIIKDKKIPLNLDLNFINNQSLSDDIDKNTLSRSNIMDEKDDIEYYCSEMISNYS